MASLPNTWMEISLNILLVEILNNNNAYWIQVCYVHKYCEKKISNINF